MLRLCLFQAVVLELERDARKLADAGGIFVTPTVVSRLKYRVDAIPCDGYICYLEVGFWNALNLL